MKNEKKTSSTLDLVRLPGRKALEFIGRFPIVQPSRRSTSKALLFNLIAWLQIGGLEISDGNLAVIVCFRDLSIAIHPGGFFFLPRFTRAKQVRARVFLEAPRQPF